LSKSGVHGSSEKTYYEGGVRSDTQLLQRHKGKIKTYKGKLK
jgi:hypothetical protein